MERWLKGGRKEGEIEVEGVYVVRYNATCRIQFCGVSRHIE